MNKYFVISGYWKDDKSEFDHHIVKEDDEAIDGEDEFIFFYGLGESELKSSSEDDALEFVVTSYEEIKFQNYGNK